MSNEKLPRNPKLMFELCHQYLQNRGAPHYELADLEQYVRYKLLHTSKHITAVRKETVLRWARDFVELKLSYGREQPFDYYDME